MWLTPAKPELTAQDWHPRSWTWWSLSPQPPALPLLSCCHPCTSTGCNLIPAQIMPRMQQQLCYCFILKHSCRRGRWHQHPSFVTQLVQRHGKQHSSFTAPLPPPASPQTSQAWLSGSWELFINALLPWTKASEHSQGMERKSWTQRAREIPWADFWGGPCGWLSSQCILQGEVPWGWGHCSSTSHKELSGKAQEPAWDERQDLKLLLPAQLHPSLHHHWHLSPLHAITTQHICHFYQFLQLSCSKLPASVI